MQTEVAPAIYHYLLPLREETRHAIKRAAHARGITVKAWLYDVIAQGLDKHEVEEDHQAGE
jgi:hypothetical protein